ncbi:hypothetical protein CDD81_2829 [Ophiocordyceps australis]|uniref:Flo11 n=1 Tax=Ophiocordyceps australis TaxID=1399860 RepID=A0A2C5XY93_9HYPO|nr:hypothetical protein CDD81_2829 [Ophiocordyceps australis]
MASPTPESSLSRPVSGVASPRPVRSRTQSISSDRPSTIGLSLGLSCPPALVSPEPAFIAPSAASQIVTNDHDNHSDAWYDRNSVEPSSEPALVSPSALQLVNGFLDQLLFNFLQVSRSTNLSALRPAVCEILKPKLAKDAIGNADEELREYLGGADEDEYSQSAALAPRTWDLELAWKRTRLRCMVYSSLGDLEEEDEDLFMEQDNLEIQRHEQASQIISPAVAIFLTSVLEYMGELTLTVAGQAACTRVRSKVEKDIKDGTRNPSDMADRIIVSDADMERVAIDRTLGRLWRGWKKRMRFPSADAASRPYSRSSAAHPLPENTMFPSEALLFKSATSISDSGSQRTKSQASNESETIKEVDPAHIPLPLGDNDVDEIEVPGLAFNSDDEQSELDQDSPTLRRPKSLVFKPSAFITNDIITSSMSQPQSPIIIPRKRSSSLPTSTPPLHRHRLRKATRAADKLGRTNIVEVGAPVVEAEVAAEKQEVEPTQREYQDADGTQDKETGVDEVAANDGVKTNQPDRVKEIEGADTEAAASKAGSGDKIKRKSIAAASLGAASAAALTATAATLGRDKSGGIDKDADAVLAPAPPASASASAPTSASASASAPTSASASASAPTSASASASAPTSASASASAAAVAAAAARGRGDETVPRPSVSSTLTLASSGSNQSVHSLGKPASSTVAAKTADSHGQAAAGRLVSPDTTDRTRSVSSSGLSSQTLSSAAAEDENQTKLTTPTRPTAKPLPRSGSASSTAYAKSSPRQTPSPTSQPDQDTDRNSHRASESSMETAGPSAMGSRGTSDQARSSVRRKAPATNTAKREPSYSHSAVTPPRSAKSSSISEDVIPEVPPKTSTRHSPKSDSRGMTPIERSKTHDTDDEPGVALHSNVTPRPIHTSASSASSATSRLKPVRTSEDGSSRSESVARNFEELIQSNQTITYTLTPENMRDTNAKRTAESPVVTKFATSASDDLRGPQSPRSPRSPTLPDAPKSPTPRQSTSSSSRRGVESNRASQQSAATSRGPVAASATMNRNGVPLAREARNTGESTLQMAEFLKATGPAPAPGEHKPTPWQQPITPASPTMASMGSRPVSTTSNRSRYQAREAVTDTNADTADLIDFIRQGPPVSASNHRIPRHVAPFRNTMDSEHLVGVAGGRAVDATIPEIRYSQGSTNMTDNSMPSMQSSVNSNTALLNKNKGAAGPSKGYDDGGMPKRKQRRVRDPYAIDLSDEEGDYGVSTTPRPAAKREESLAEFLRNYDPPPEPASAPAQVPRKKASAPSLIGRLTRTGGKDVKEPNGPPAAPKGVMPRQDARSSVSRPGGRGGYIPIQVNMPPGYDNKYGGTNDVTPAPSRKPSSATSSGPRVPMKKFEPREAVVSRSQTADLAAFLRDSGPPEITRASPAPLMRDAARHDDSSAISKRFGRKKRP